MNLRYWLLGTLVLARFFDLEVRPPHHDEAVNGWFVDGIFNKGFYHYDPQNYHGPLYFYILTALETIFGRHLWVLRAPSVVFGALLTFSPFLFRRWIGERAAMLTAFFLAVSPAMIFYSRYAIHEMGFALGCVAFLYLYFVSRENGISKKLAIGLGVTLGFMAAFKETFIVFLGTLFIAEAVLWVMNKIPPFMVKNSGSCFGIGSAKGYSRSMVLKSLGWFMGSFALVIVFTFTGGFQDLSGIPNFFKAFMAWSHTGEAGNGHQKPFYYWLMLMGKHEGFALLGLLLTPLALRRLSAELRLMSIVGFGLWLAYSIVNYKTPWCLLSFFWLLAMVAGYWLSKIPLKILSKKVLAMLVAFWFSFFLWKGIEVSWIKPDQDRHDYIYGATYRDFMGPNEEILNRVKANPELKKTLTIQIISQFTWPLPYILGEIKKVAYHTDSNPPARLNAEYVLIDESLLSKYEPRFEGPYTSVTVRSRQWASPMVFFKKLTAETDDIAP